MDMLPLFLAALLPSLGLVVVARQVQHATVRKHDRA